MTDCMTAMGGCAASLTPDGAWTATRQSRLVQASSCAQDKNAWLCSCPPRDQQEQGNLLQMLQKHS